MKKCDKNHNGVPAMLLLKSVRMRNESLFRRRNILYEGMNVKESMLFEMNMIIILMI